MTYNEWRDELKSNLLCVPESEMMRVLDYYAEAYADRRDAGYSEREITAEFGAPYDAAQRILAESVDYPIETLDLGEKRAAQPRVKPRPKAQDAQPRNQEPQEDARQAFTNTQPPQQNTQAKSNGHGWIFTLLCVIFAIPLLGLVMSMVGVSIGFSVTPFALIVAGVGSIVQGVVEMFSDVALGAVTIGIGLVAFGLGLILAPIFFKIVKLMWKLFNKFFMWLKSLFSGKEN